MSAIPSAHDPANNLRGIVAMLAAMAAFVFNDTMVKLASAHIPMGEVIFLRGAATAAMCAGLLLLHAPPRVLVQAFAPPLVARGVCDVGASLTFLFALLHLPIADAYAILQFTPLALTAGAALFLGAHVGWRRWLATGVGLIGVLIVVRPGGASFNAYSVFALVSIAFSVGRDLVTRRISLAIPSFAIALTSTVLLTFAALALAAVEPWRAPSFLALALVLAAAVTLLAGQYWLIAALRTGEIAVVAPFRYSIIVWSVIAGLAVWSELPDRPTIIGIAIVFGAGLYTFLREQTLSRAGKL